MQAGAGAAAVGPVLFLPLGSLSQETQGDILHARGLILVTGVHAALESEIGLCSDQKVVTGIARDVEQANASCGGIAPGKESVLSGDLIVHENGDRAKVTEERNRVFSSLWTSIEVMLNVSAPSSCDVSCHRVFFFSKRILEDLRGEANLAVCPWTFKVSREERMINRKKDYCATTWEEH